MKLLEFYEKLLNDANVFNDNGDGYLSAHHGTQVIPLTIDKRRLVLPVDDLLREGRWDEYIAFHPMSEKANRGESPVLKAFKAYIVLRLTSPFQYLLKELMHFAASPALHKGAKPSPKAAEYLKLLSGVDEKAFKAVEGIIKAMNKDPNNRLVSIYLKRGGTGEDDYIRTAVVGFPILDEFEREDDLVFGVKMSAKTKAAVKVLIEYILGDEDARKMYTVGTKNLDAPYFHCLISAFYKLANRFNVLLERHKKQLADAESAMFGLEWATMLDELAMYRGLIPTQNGNEGVPLTPDGKEDTTAPVPAVASRAFNRQSQNEADLPFDVNERDDGRRGAPVAARDEKPASGTVDYDTWKRNRDGGGSDRDRERDRDDRGSRYDRDSRDSRSSSPYRQGFRDAEAQDDRFETRRGRMDGGGRNIERGGRNRGNQDRGGRGGRGGFL